MHFHFLDPYQPRASAIHALDPRIKLMLAIGYILCVALMPSGAWLAYGLAFALALSVILFSDLGVANVLKKSAVALPFVLAAAPLIITAGGPALARVGGVAISANGAARFLSIAIKSWLSVQMAIVLASSTSFPDLLLAMRGLRFPKIFVSIFGLMWRYLFVLADEALRMMRARAARSGEREGAKAGGGLAWRAKVTGGMAGSLFLRGIERGDRIYLAMASRGYDGEIRSFPLPRILPSQWLVLGMGLAALALLLAVAFALSGI
jgi:cobalt/nickel transport system permease protein